MDKLKVCFVRHGETKSNILGNCCGRINLLLSDQGRDQLKELRRNHAYPEVERVFSSPAIRCRETAQVIYPDLEPELVYNLWEFDFGNMDDRPIAEVRDFVGADRWAQKENDCMFPGGESLLEASLRIRAGMTRVIQRCIEDDLSRVAVFTHGEILYALVRACMVTDEPAESFILCPNGMGYEAEVDKKGWFSDQKIYFDKFIPEGAKRPRPEDSPYFR
ncbi:MAG: histidine phosphatase family protein [Lachnospiraceae bacterium]|nr:histidine phosphatase family protein [Lachnospiraceae bacterium]